MHSMISSQTVLISYSITLMITSLGREGVCFVAPTLKVDLTQITKEMYFPF